MAASMLPSDWGTPADHELHSRHEIGRGGVDEAVHLHVLGELNLHGLSALLERYESAFEFRHGFVDRRVRHHIARLHGELPFPYALPELRGKDVDGDGAEASIVQALGVDADLVAGSYILHGGIEAPAEQAHREAT